MNTPRRFSFQFHAYLAAFFFISLTLFTWRNHFPFFYHSDEESKAIQLLYGYRNYWHPMLMLNATRFLMMTSGANHDSQTITMIGRTLSAFFSAVGVTTFVHLASRRMGIFSGILTGIFLLLSPLLFEVSHYCKEDPALFMGYALSLLALDSFFSERSLKRVLLLGTAVGIATSAKYPGVLLVIGLTPVIAWQSRKWHMVVFFLLTAAMTVLLLNYEWLFHLPEVFAGVHRESAMLLWGHDGMANQFPQAQYWRILLYQQGWPILIAALLGMVLAARRKNRFSLELGLGLSCLFLLGVLSFSAKVSERYILPIMATTLYLAACGVTLLGQKFHGYYKLTFHLIAILLLSLYPAQLLGRYCEDFQKDSRGDLARWILAHHIRKEELATSLWTRLPGIYEAQFITGVTPPDYVADLGTLDQLRSMGFRWVIVSDVESLRFLSPEQTGDSLSRFHFERRQIFYETLRNEADLRWSEVPGPVYNLQPGLKLYELRSKPEISVP